MKLYLDTEFNEFGGALISMGISTPDPKQDFYEVLHCHNPGAWVKEHVIPILYRDPISLPQFQSRLLAFLRAQISTLPYGHALTLVTDYPDDIAYFCKALITGPGMRLAVDDINFEMRCGLAYTSKTPHNALEDARALRVADAI